MNLSIIIPTLNGESNLKNLILKLQEQTLAPKEIIIVDSSSNDNTIGIAKELHCYTIIIERDKFDHGGTRNLGVLSASGEIIVFMTQDAIPADNMLLECLIAPLSNTQIAASFARQIARPEAIPPEQFARLFNYPDIPDIKSKEDLPSLGIKTFFFSNVCSAVKKRAYQAVGGFPERTIMNEDMILAAKLILSGWKIAYCPNAIVWHSHNYSIWQHLQRYFDIGASFNLNKWILEYAKAEGEGIKFVKEQIKYLVKHRYWEWIPYSLVLTMVRYLGFKLGLFQNKLPTEFKYLLSMNKIFWLNRSK